MPISLTKLQVAGFEHAGKWVLTQQGLGLDLNDVIGNKKDVLYAFAVDGALRYVGKTASTLRSRLQGYKTPPATANSGASTNIKNHQNIVAALKQGSTVDIYALHTLPPQEHFGFLVSFTAGLEDSLIKDLTPLWNGRALMQIRDGLTPSKSASSISRSTEKSIRQITSVPQNADVGIQHYPTVEMLFHFARSVKGQTLETLARGMKFTVEIIGTTLQYTPEKSHVERPESQKSLARLLEQLEETHSFQMSDYQRISFNASYDLALIRAWQQRNL
ncbi:MAG: GIY-YIG nuclease family protein [Herbaspirillum sp.]